MKAYVIFTKKRFALLLSVLICVGFISYRLSVAGSNIPNAKTNADRLIFIKNAGYAVIDSNPECKSITIPTVFYDVYNNYNAIQKKSGYDLMLYKGCEAMLYTYKINPPADYSGQCVINIIVYNDRVIGGDVSSTALDGFMLPI